MSNIVTLYINSKDRVMPNSANTNFIYNLFPLGVNNVVSYYVKAVTIPVTNYVTIYPPSNGTSSQTFNFNNGISYTITIPVGNYTAPQLASVVQTQINAVTSPDIYSVTYSSTTNLFTIAGTPSFTVNFTIGNYSYPYQSIGSVMGFRLNDSFHTPGIFTGSSVTAPYEASLSGPLNYYIQSNTFTVMTNSFFQSIKSNVICCVPNTAPPFGVITYINPNPIYEPNFKINIAQLNFRLVDEYGNEPILNDDWTISISLRCDVL
jgi:hypothetical protein